MPTVSSTEGRSPRRKMPTGTTTALGESGSG